MSETQTAYRVERRNPFSEWEGFDNCHTLPEARRRLAREMADPKYDTPQRYRIVRETVVETYEGGERREDYPQGAAEALQKAAQAVIDAHTAGHPSFGHPVARVRAVDNLRTALTGGEQ